MLFSSSIFLFAFLPAVLLGYYVVFRGMRRAQNGLLLAASLFFYAWGEPWFVLVMIGSILANYGFGLWVHARKSRGRRLLLPVASACVCNLGLLFVFKYLVFTLENLNLLGLNLPIPGIELPIGISFFTFQALSYVLDVALGEAQVQRSPFALGLYVSLFPQLIAGPIVKYSTVASELKGRRETWADFSAGCCRFLVGLGKKVLLSNQLALVADAAWETPGGELSTAFAWLGSLCYTLQIYYDFSGYSDMAIGLGRIFGFRFNENFDHPYCADSVGTFWRRWHMSLTSWFRDYLYIPLGGNRGGTARTIRNLLIVWFCTGFWHGASWNFILWGLYFAAWLILERYVLRGVLEKTPAILKHLYTLIVVFVGWGLFAMVDLGVCGDYLAACFGGAPLWSGADLFRLRSYAVTLAVLVLASTALGQRLWAKLPRQAEQLATPVLMGLSLVVCTAYLVDGSYNPFLYFRF